MTYATARTLDAQTGDWTYTTAFAVATSPAMELVKRILRTTRGTCLLDPTLVVDWAKVDPLGTNSEATGEVVIRAALAPLVSRGAISDVNVAVTVDGTAGKLTYTVDFVDVRLQQQQSLTGTR